MSLASFADYAAKNWPQALASGVLIPGLQFFASQLWQARRRVRLATIRKEIVETEEFLKRYTGEPLDPVTADALKLYHDERLKMFAELQRLSTPFDVLHPGTTRVLSFFLISRPRYAISLLTRGIFFVALFAMCKALPRFVQSGAGWDTILGAVLDAAAFQYLTRVVEGANGHIVPRPWWQRLTLIYGPASGLAFVLHVLFWGTSLTCLVEAARYYARIRSFELDGAVSLIMGIFALLVWWFAVHLDREAPPTTGLSEATAA